MAQSDGARIRRLARSPMVEIMVTTRGARRLDKECISRPDAHMALCNCRVINSERRHGQWRRTVVGQDAEGKTIRLVVVVDPDSERRIVVFSGTRVKENEKEHEVSSSA